MNQRPVIVGMERQADIEQRACERDLSQRPTGPMRHWQRGRVLAVR